MLNYCDKPPAPIGLYPTQFSSVCIDLENVCLIRSWAVSNALINQLSATAWNQSTKSLKRNNEYQNIYSPICIFLKPFI